MRTSQYLLSTLKEFPANVEVDSHQLMLRSGMIRQLSSGLYSWLPIGLRVLRKVENIIRKEMDNVGAIELSMPMVQPAGLWRESGRLIQYGPELLRFTDREDRPFVLGPTHEEVISNLIRNEVNSYKQLPLTLYQIQTKFRDEIRPRFGVIRAREFVMKDAYSFHTNQVSLQVTYDTMHQVYSSIFARMELEFRVVLANTGSIGGNISHEFQVLVDGGEDNIAFSTLSNHADNTESDVLFSSSAIHFKPIKAMRLVDAPGAHNITELVTQFSLPLNKTIKTILVKASKESGHMFVALIIRGDHNLNHAKVKNLPQVSIPLTLASEEEIRLAVGVSSSYLGPVNLSLPLVIDYSVAQMSDFVAGANIEGQYFFGINWGRDLPFPQVADLCAVVNSNLIMNSNSSLKIKRVIEVGHIFQLGTKYSEAMKVAVQDASGHKKILIMGCYGIGITRIVAAVIEQNHDNRGILWPEILAPFDVAILPMNMYRSCRVQRVTEDLYQQLQALGIDVLLDDRKERPGVIFADMELIGVPHQLIIGERNLEIGKIEYKNRRRGDYQMIKLSDIVNFLLNKVIKDKL